MERIISRRELGRIQLTKSGPQWALVTKVVDDGELEYVASKAPPSTANDRQNARPLSSTVEPAARWSRSTVVFEPGDQAAGERAAELLAEDFRSAQSRAEFASLFEALNSGARRTTVKSAEEMDWSEWFTELNRKGRK